MYISHGEMVINSSPFIWWMVIHLLVQIQVPEATNSKFPNDHSKEGKKSYKLKVPIYHFYPQLKSQKKPYECALIQVGSELWWGNTHMSAHAHTHTHTHTHTHSVKNPQ